MNNKISQDINAAVAALQNAELVAFPTETVYGLGADARNATAILKVFAAKGRPSDHPLIVHIGNPQQMTEWAINIPAAAWQLADAFWPGPLTLILPKHPAVSDLITGGQNSIALRMPAHPIAQQLLQKFGSGLVGPSANRYGHVSPTTAQHVIDDLDNAIAYVLDGGPCTIGIESTIVNLLDATPTIMRQGAITTAQLQPVLQQAIITNATTTVRSSGTHASHYAPRTPAYMFPFAKLLPTVQQYIDQHLTCSVISMQPKPSNLPSNLVWQTVSNDPKLYAQGLYANLRSHDQLNTAAILLEEVPHDPQWAAIDDRLRRAIFKK